MCSIRWHQQTQILDSSLWAPFWLYVGMATVAMLAILPHGIELLLTLVTRIHVGMVAPSMIAILGHGVEILLTLVTRILKQSRKVLAFHMPSQISLTWAHMTTDVAPELSKVRSLPDLFNVVIQVKLSLYGCFEANLSWVVRERRSSILRPMAGVGLMKMVAGIRLNQMVRTALNWVGLKPMARTAPRDVLPTGQSFHLQLLSNSKEAVEVRLGHVDLPVVYKAQHCFQIRELDPFHVDERMAVLNFPQNFLEEGGAGSQNHPVCFNLLISTDQGSLLFPKIEFFIKADIRDWSFYKEVTLIFL